MRKGEEREGERMERDDYREGMDLATATQKYKEYVESGVIQKVSKTWFMQCINVYCISGERSCSDSAPFVIEEESIE